MKKTYKVKNYKGNLVESLNKFTAANKGMRIVEAKVEGDELKITAEASGNKFWWFREANHVGNSYAADEKINIKTLDQLRSAMKKKGSTLALIDFVDDPEEEGQIIFAEMSDDMSEKDITNQFRQVLDSFDRESGDDLEYNDED